MEIVFKCGIAVILAYLIGSFSPSITLGKIKGIDIRKVGSGNAGTTNVLRVMGGKAALITLSVDILKGLLAVLLGVMIVDGNHLISYECAFAVCCGHIWPCYYGFKGGKGVAVAFGGLLGVNWRVALLCLLVAAVLTVLSKRMSVGSITAACSLPLVSLWLEPGFWPYALIMALIVVIMHRSNIVRLFKGEEPPMSIFEKKNNKKG